jgi:hypothetical protein
MRMNPEDSEEEEEPEVDEVKVMALVLHTGVAAAGDGKITLQVRKTPSWPRSWANFSLIYPI